MATDLAELISNLRQIEEKLIHEESVLVGIRCEIRDALSLASTIWDHQAQENMNAKTSRPSFAHRCKFIFRVGHFENDNQKN